MHAHFDCFSGISGDMVLGAFVDMGITAQWLSEKIHRLGIDNVEIIVKTVKKNGVGAKKIDIIENGIPPARNFRNIINLIENGGLGGTINTLAIKIFSCIAKAEARIHQCEVGDVHFHEVGAVDSIVDIVGVAACIDHFNIKSVSSSPLPLGSGFVDCSHGRLPVPAPATLEILKGVPVHGGGATGEMVTPTGAGIIASLSQSFGPIPPMNIRQIGYGSGSRDHQTVPNLLRILIGNRNQDNRHGVFEDVCTVETNIDDMNPEILGYVMEKLLSSGALDVCFTPVVMKKNRPGTKVEVLCAPEKRESVTNCLLTETTTTGVRYASVQRQILKRSLLSVKTCFGDIQVKGITDPTGRTRYTPEYDACRKIAIANDIPLQTVYQTVAETVHSGGISRENEKQSDE